MLVLSPHIWRVEEQGSPKQRCPSAVLALLLTSPQPPTGTHSLLSGLPLPSTSVKTAHPWEEPSNITLFFLVDVSCFSGFEKLKKSCPSLQHHFFEMREILLFLFPPLSVAL